MIKKLLFLFSLIVFPCKFALCQVQTPENWLETKGHDLIKVLSCQDRKSRYEQTMQIAKTSFHENELSKLALGRLWNKLDASQQKRYQSLFFDYFVSEYTNNPLPVGNIEFTITDKIVDKDILLAVNVKTDLALKIKNDNNKKLSIDVVFALRRDGNSYYIRDVQVEGESMLLFVRGKIMELYNNSYQDPDTLLNKMQNRIYDTTHSFREVEKVSEFLGEIQ
ncbi:MAG: ABC transporter substrate-binding protein [Alphaproteobacteria bacterium]|nr:ABC transporter substrate-binding protein [Alphaproteobacteria bacterium]